MRLPIVLMAKVRSKKSRENILCFCVAVAIEKHQMTFTLQENFKFR